MIAMHRAALIAALLLFVAACGTGQAPESAEHGRETERHDGETPALKLDAAARAAAGIELAVLAPGSVNERLRAPGEVIDNAYGTTLVTPRVEAIVERRHVKLGDEVVEGAPLVTLSSIEVAQAQGALRIAEQEWERVRALGRDAVSGRRYAEAQVAVEQARATARAYGVGGGASNGEFTLKAPHAGRITEDAFLVGERIEPGRTLFRLVDEAIVWVDARLPAERAQRIAVDTPADVVLGDVRLAGRVVQRAHRTSEDTRNALVRIEVPNDGDQLHGGDYVEVYLSTDAASDAASLSVPTAALVQFEGDTVVFREAQDGTLGPVAVRTGAVIGDRTLVLEGLSAGDRIAVAGAYALKSQMLKAQLGEGHAH